MDSSTNQFYIDVQQSHIMHIIILYYFRLFVISFPDISIVKICNSLNKNEHIRQKDKRQGKQQNLGWHI